MSKRIHTNRAGRNEYHSELPYTIDNRDLRACGAWIDNEDGFYVVIIADDNMFEGL